MYLFYDRRQIYRYYSEGVILNATRGALEPREFNKYKESARVLV